MKKSLTKFFSLIALAGVVFLSSCGSSEDAVTPNAPTVTVALQGNGSLEVGDVATYAVTAAIPGGFKAGSTSITVGSGTATPGQLPTGAINAGDTTASFNLTFTVPSTAAVGDMIKFSVTVIDNSDQSTTSSEATFTVVAAGQGGGGTVPLLRGTATVSLGSEGNTTLGSYLASSTATVYKSADATANQATIDITFGVGTTGGPSLISPDARQAAGLNQTNAPRTTFFKAEASGPTDLGTVKAIDVENNISASTTKNVQITQGSVYSFVQSGSTGKKGYILIKTLSGTGTNRTAEIEFVVQQ